MQRSGSRSVILEPVQLAFPYQPQSWSDFQTYGRTKRRRGNPFRGKDLPPPLAFTNEGSRKRKGLRHYENAVTPSGVSIPLVGGIPAFRHNSPRFKHIGPRRRSDGAPCSPFDVRTLDAAAPEVRAGTSNCKVMVVVVFPRTVRPFGAWGHFQRRSLARRREETSFQMKRTLFDGTAIADTIIRVYCPITRMNSSNPLFMARRIRQLLASILLSSKYPPEVPFFTEHDGSPIIEDTRKSPPLSIESSPSSSDKPFATPEEDNAQPKYLSLTHDHHHASQAQALETPNDHNYGELMPGNWPDLASETDSPSAGAEYPCTSEAVGTYAAPDTDSNLAGSHRKSKTEFNFIPPKLIHMDAVLASGPDAETQAHRKSSTEFKEVVATGGR
ncbi:hypothetical protein CSAL01_08062 [Colletotrichum salicis]|uniref:Uncharacterized protein n=1 Tax=Colletotrichum salicis TaxID=1209931 RepID=A0A135UNG0_9PEZI|nr:hypothetical protein CSAL01_08062 [Colletotrichum salicis]